MIDTIISVRLETIITGFDPAARRYGPGLFGFVVIGLASGARGARG